MYRIEYMFKKLLIFIFFILGFSLQLYSVMIALDDIVRDAMLFRVPPIFKFFKYNFIECHIFYPMLIGAVLILIALQISGFKYLNILHKNDDVCNKTAHRPILREPTFFKLLLVTFLSAILLYIPNKNIYLQYLTFSLMMICLILLLKFYNLKMRIYNTLEIDNKDIKNIALLCVLYFIIHINFLVNPTHFHWYDEGPFFELASDLIKSNFQARSFFDQHGIWGKNPIAGSVQQALMMLPFGISIFSFRLTSLISIMVSIIPMYIISKFIASRNVAIITGLLICFSHYFYNFTDLSYNNILGIPFTLFAVLFFLTTIIKKSYNSCILCGIFSGLCWYQYGLATLCVFAYPLCLLLGTSKSDYKGDLKRLFIIYYIMFLFIMPMYFRTEFEQNIYYFIQNASPEKFNSNIMATIYHRLKIAYFQTFTFGQTSHWVFRNSQDIFSQIFLFLGFFICIKNVFSYKRIRLFFVLAMLIWFMLAILNHHEDFQNTRISYVLVYWLIITSIGIEVFVKFLFKNRKLGYLTLMSLIIFLNYNWAVSFPYKYSYRAGYETSLVEVGYENKDVNRIYALYPADWDNYIYRLYFDAFLLMQDIKIVKQDKLNEFPDKLKTSDLIVINQDEKDLAIKLSKKYKNEPIGIVERKNISNHAHVYIIGLKETLRKYFAETVPNEIMVNRII